MYLQSLVVIVFAASQVSAEFLLCPWVTGKKPFDAEKFAGDWYPHYFNTKEETYGKLACSVFSVGASSAGNTTRFDLRLGGVLNGQSIVTKGVAQTIFPKMDSTWLAYWVPLVQGETKGLFKVSITATDYENYAILHSCSETYDPKTNSFDKTVLVSVLGRQRTMSDEALQTLRSVASSFNGLDANMIRVNQNNC